MTTPQIFELSENGRRLEVAVITSLTVSGVPSESDISVLAGQLRKISIYAVIDEEFDLVLKRLHEALRIDMGLGNRIVSDYQPWLSGRKANIKPFYWDRYLTDLRTQGWAPKVLNSLDRVTDDILDLLGDPAGESGWPRRGLVMGDVQSGKTSNYTGLICKASDAGYRLVILLTGTLESLRRQTQERLDWGFVGLDSSGILNRNKQRREIGVGIINGTRAAGVFTSTLADFRATTVNQLGFKLSSFNEPVLLVVKKNKRILENLATWLLTFNASQGGRINLPMLLIDDEADNASVNTNPKKVTAINAGIRNLLNLFPRSSYVAFTATPFANVFINPDSDDQMEGDDLFPRDFIYTLDAPTNYVGASRIFGDEGDLACTRSIKDAEISFPKGMKSEFPVKTIPKSLVEAVHCFFIVNVIMDQRHGMPKHRSMLVNVSHFSKVQDQVRDILDDIVRSVQRDIRNYAMLPPAEALKNGSLLELKRIFEQEYPSSDKDWESIQRDLPNAVLPVIVRSINQNAGPSSLDYSQYKQSGLRVIAVGGNSLSRGLTLEGLCVSYFYRNTQMYDALLQMGRWFGYRPGYEDLFRVWITDVSKNWYAHIAEATDELRAEIRGMQLSRLRPIDFGLKVRAHPESLLITARNKMQHSEKIVRSISISQEAVESTRVSSDEQIIVGNFKSAQHLLTSLKELRSSEQVSGGYLWKEISKDLIVNFLRSYSSHPLNIKLQARDLADFIENSREPRLRSWDVFVPGGDGAEFPPSLMMNLHMRRRAIVRDKSPKTLLINGTKMRVGSRGDEKAGLDPDIVDMAERKFREDPQNTTKKNVSDKAYREFRERPLFILHVVDGILAPSEEVDAGPIVPDGLALIAIGLSFPRLNVESQKVIYRINLVELRNMLASEQEDLDGGDDEDEDDEAA